MSRKTNAAIPSIEDIYKRNISRVLKAGRKSRLRTQADLAAIIQRTQSYYSKLESGSSVPSAAEWAILCHTLTLPTESIISGYLDNLRPLSVEVDPMALALDFKIAPAYLENARYSIRSLQPLIRVARTRLGEKGFVKKMKSLSVDPDYLTLLDNRLGWTFLRDLSHEVRGKGGRSGDSIPDEEFCSPQIHGELFSSYRNSRTPFDALDKYLELSPYYDCDYRKSIRRVDKRRAEVRFRREPGPIGSKMENAADCGTAAGDVRLTQEYHRLFLKGICHFATEATAKKSISVSILPEKRPASDAGITYVVQL